MKKWIARTSLACGVVLLAGACAKNDAVSPATSATEETSLAQNAISGTFSSTAAGFGGDIKVDVTLKDSVIESIDADFSSETPSIGQVAGPQMIEKIIANQSINLDAIAGATVTTTAVKEAVKQALETAGADMTGFEKEVAKSTEEINLEADLVVVGTGGAGTAAALVAAQNGKNVIIIEKNTFVGGNTKLSHGFFAIGTKWQEAAGVDVNIDEAVRQLLVFNDYLSNGPLTRAVVEKSAETVEWIDSLGMKVSLQEGTTQFAHSGDNYKAQSYHIYDNTEEGFANLYVELEKLGAKLYLGTTMESLIYEDGQVKGIVATNADGAKVTVRAKATMVATGGYGANEEMIKAVTHDALLNSLGVANMGEGLNAMVSVGAKDIDSAPLLHAAQLAASEVTTSTSEEHLAGFSNSPITQLLMSPLLWVDPSGSRFANEDVVYDTAFWANAAYAAGGKYYFIVDKATLDAYTNGSDMLISKAGPGANMDSGDFVALAEQAVEAKTAFKGETIEELAANAGMEDLAATVERYNTMVENRNDTDYAKSVDSLKYTVSEGPFYAFDCRAVFLGTIGGVRVNEKLEVLDVNGKAIPGLYTGGTNAGGYYHGEGYPPYEGLASGFTWTSGKIAGESILRFLDK